ncbi:MAG: indole-3-glycerol phosphate synthase TrpC [bacterium]
MAHILTDIVYVKKKAVQGLKNQVSIKTLEKQSASICLQNRLTEALKKNDTIKIIAEYKRASPSAGIISLKDVAEVCMQYKDGGAAAVSILTEEDFFNGSLQDIDTVKKRIDLPVLRKDFIIDVYQIFETIVHGAEAVLLITAVLERKELAFLLETAGQFKLDAVVEVHSRKELDTAVDAGAGIIGINNRNLNDFSTNLQVTEDLMPHIPEGLIVISESGFKSPQDIQRFKESRVNAVLIGESLMKAADIRAFVQDLVQAGR